MSGGRIAFVTLGCAKNEVDSNRMRALLGDSPFEYTPELDQADAIVVNTCSFLAEATLEGIDTVLELTGDAEGIHPPIIMTGCIPSRYGTDLESLLPEVSAFLPVAAEDTLVETLSGVLDVPLDDDSSSRREGRTLRVVDAAHAYVKISDGCDRYCSFCAIPYIRGRYVSRTEEDILAEVEGLLAEGVREIVLIGQDTGIWGSDLHDGSELADLLDSVARAASPFGAWVRVLYLQPEGITPELLATMERHDAILPYFDIPLQHSDAGILRAMNRTGDAESFLEMVRSIRETLPGAVLRTTVIAGFPGETEEQAEALEAFLEEAEFDYLAVFPYSQEDGTKAAELEGQVADAVKLERAQRLHDLGDAIGFTRAGARVGETHRVLLDGHEDDDGTIRPIGRAWFQAPDSDGITHVMVKGELEGPWVDVVIDDAVCYDLFGEPAHGGDRRE